MSTSTFFTRTHNMFVKRFLQLSVDLRMAAEFVPQTTWQVTNQMTDQDDINGILWTEPKITPNFFYMLLYLILLKYMS